MDLYRKITKLPVNENAMDRPRVDAMLEESMQYPAVVVAAGAGFGKTQAVAGFLERSTYRGVWLQLTVLDNLPMRFWESFLHTVSLHKETLGEKLRELGFPDSLYKYNKFMQLFTEELYTDDQFVVFVFDDFQLLHDETVLQFFKYFVSATLENICLLFITRDLESYSLTQRVYVLTTEDLRFTKEETADYFEGQGIEPANASELEKIHSYTGGWPMALYLTALQLKKEGQNAEDRLLNSQQAVFRLIEKEIFSYYSKIEQKFFTILSHLNFFPRGLLQEVGNYVGADAEALLQNNVFVSYDPKAKNYYLHRVFLDFLAEKQYLIESELKNDMLCKAAEWCFQNSYHVDAIDYYDRCGDPDKAWDVILSFEGIRHDRDEAELFIRYIRRFPDGSMTENPMRRIVYALLLLNNLDMEEAQEQAFIVHKQLDSMDDTPENRELRGEAYVASGLISLGLENFDFVECFKQADALLPDGSRRWGKGLRLVEYSNALNISSPEKGALEQSVAHFFDGMPYVSKVLHGSGYGLEYLASAEGHFLTNDLKNAQKDAYQALYMAEEETQPDIADNSLFLLLRIFLVNGDVKNIENISARLRKKEREDDVQLQGVSDIALGWLYSDIGEIRKVAGWILFEQTDNLPPISVDKESLLEVRCLIEEQNYYEAIALLGRLMAIYKKRNTLISQVYACVYRAIAHYQTDNMAQAMLAVKQAYELAHGNGLVMPFIEYGHRTRALLDYARKQKDSGIPAEWLENIHTKASTYAKRHSYIISQLRDADAAPVDYGLTGREIELLRNMSQGLTRDEIAGSMYVSPHTVKSMLKTAYNKMGAVNSADAVRIAIGAGLI